MMPCLRTTDFVPAAIADIVMCNDGDDNLESGYGMPFTVFDNLPDKRDMVKTMRNITKLIAAIPLALFMLGANAAEFEKGEDGGILIPPNAEMLLYSGSINFAMPDGCGFRDAGKEECPAGDMEAQGTAILEGFKDKLEARGWSMENVVRVNVYGVAGEDGSSIFRGSIPRLRNSSAGKMAAGTRPGLSLKLRHCSVPSSWSKSKYSR